MKVVTFGEIMLRLAPKGYFRFVQATEYQATFGGAEANVATSLACLGIDASFVTKLPNNEIGQSAINSIRALGVDTRYIVRGDDRIGIFFCEKGASQRPSKVIYDRAHSSIANARPEEFDWNTILNNVDWFHWTGITPALGDGVALILEKALKVCKEKNIKVSCDLNYRNKLWSKEKARKVMTNLMPYVNVCISNEEDAYDVFGIKAEDTDVIGGKISLDGYKSVAEQLVKTFKFDLVAITLRESISASNNNWAGLLYDGKEHYISNKYNIHLVDRVGGGDSFGAGLIYSLLKKFDYWDAIEFAVASSCLKQTIEGDFNVVSVDEVLKLKGGDGSGRVQR